ncbi:MAG: hypothetical protein CMQ41_07705 [Gammaproteobacteria bacterium]|nr:hypothetical protein [Gammaproteobacteria bacterium]|tara:strand:- start:203 stop:811 length:609 start_codon:yes stop_codon:yes gene_type:complete
MEKAFDENDVAKILDSVKGQDGQPLFAGKYQLRTQSTGNVQVQITDLGSYNDRAKCRILLAMADAIFESGIIPETEKNDNEIIRLSWPTGRKDPETKKEIWVPYPQMWINQPNESDKTAAANTQAVDHLTQKVDQLTDVVRMLAENQLGQQKNIAATQSAPAAPAKTRKKKAGTKKVAEMQPEPAPIEELEEMEASAGSPPF